MRAALALAAWIASGAVAGRIAQAAPPRAADAAAIAAPAGHAIVALAAADDARKAILVGAGGEVYAPDGRGGWVHRLASTTADPLTAAGRAGDAVVALGDGVVYRLADNGWSAIRLVQHGKAILGTGPRALAAVGRQLFALDAMTRGEPTRIAQAPANIIAIGASAQAIVVATETAVFRLAVAGGKAARAAAAVAPKLVPLAAAPRRPRLASDRWAITDRGALDLTTAKLTRWPSGVIIGVAAAGPDDALVAIGSTHAGLELITVRGGIATREPIAVAGAAITGTAVGVVVDGAGRAVVALGDGRIAVRDRQAWTLAELRDEPPAEHPGAGPASSAP